jgi:glycosyltransferase involved in cell wall biosynthesis
MRAGESSGNAASGSRLRPARVLVIAEDMSFTFDTRVQNVARTMTASGMQVRVVCPRYRGDPASRVVDGIRVDYYPTLRFGSGLASHVVEYVYSLLLISVYALRAFLTAPFDCVHICNPPDFLFPIGLFYRALGRRFIFDQHDAVPELFAARYPAAPACVYTALRGFQWLSMRAANHVLVTNESLWRNAVRAGIPADRVTIVRNGPLIDQTVLAKAPPSTDGLIRIGYLGNINPQDGLDLLLEAAAHCVHTAGRNDIRFTCIGDGSAFRDVVERANALRVEHVVDFVGRMEPKEALRRLAACDICVQPDPRSPYTEMSTMVKALEYMLLGKPIVSFDLVETRASCSDAAVYAHEETPIGLAEEILRLAGDRELRALLGARGRARIERSLAWSHSEPPLQSAYNVALRPTASSRLRPRAAALSGEEP